MKFRNRIAVFAPSGALLFTANATQAGDLLAGGATVYSLRLDAVSAIKLSEGQIAHGDDDHLWPGSYGIKRETIKGHKVFDHNKTWAKQLLANQPLTSESGASAPR